MKKLIAFGLLATALSFADTVAPTEVASLQKEPVAVEAEPVKSSLAYISLGLGPFPIPMPLFGVGGRFQGGHHGFDISLQGITFGRGFTVLRENLDYLYYFKPKLASQFYMGLGMSFTEVLVHRGKCRAYLSPQIVIGNQYTNNAGDVRFFQAQIDPVFINLNTAHKRKSWRKSWGTFPAVVISYGICF